MSLTHLSGLAVSGTVQLSGAVISTGAASTVKTLAASGTTRVSGIFSASAAGKQSSLTKLAISGTTVLSGAVQATGSGKTVSVATLSVSGKSTLGHMVVSSAANAVAGIRNIATASATGIGAKYSIPTTKVLTSSRIFLQPMTVGARAKMPMVNTISTGASFSIKQILSPTACCTGPVAWFIVNQT